MVSGIGGAADVLLTGAGDIYDKYYANLSSSDGYGGYPGRGFGYGVAGTMKTTGQDY
jgi:hypothetical protein